MILNITHAGRTTEHSMMLDSIDLDDDYVLRLAEEVRGMERGTLNGFVIDRMPVTAGSEPRFYVRPKVPFGSERIGEGPSILAVANLMQATDRDRLNAQLEIAVEALLQYSTSPTSGDRARDALARIAHLDEAP